MRSTCPRCTGTGRTRYLHVEGGICFACSGTGYRNARSSAKPPTPSKPLPRYALQAFDEDDQAWGCVVMSGSDMLGMFDRAQELDTNYELRRLWRVWDRSQERVAASWST